MTSWTPDLSTPVSPARVHHVFYKTRRMAAMAEFYALLLGAHVSHTSHEATWLTYDEAHHRVSLWLREEFDDQLPRDTGLDHVCFQYDELDHVLHTFERVKRHGLLPWWTVNHGLSIAFYYRDPDWNGVELQVENFATPEQWFAFQRGPQYAANSVGVNFDPERMLDARRAGATHRELHERSYAGELLGDGQPLVGLPEYPERLPGPPA